MDRTEFLQMAQKVSVLKNGICGIKENVPDELTVVYNGIKYYPAAYELSFDDKGKSIHTAILKDLKANSLIYCRLEDVRSVENEKVF